MRIKHYAPTKWHSPCLNEVANLTGSNARSACDGVEVTRRQSHLQPGHADTFKGRQAKPISTAQTRTLQMPPVGTSAHLSIE
jgi:hypothetical protein